VSVDLESRTELQTRNALPVHRHKMQTSGGNADVKLLNGATVSTRKERGLTALLGKKKRRRDVECASSLGSGRGGGYLEQRPH
jgi:hypothetical protein